MSDLKMSDVFGGNLTVRSICIDEFNDASVDSDDFHVIDDSDHWCCSNENHIEYAIHAINAYDSNQELIASQEKEIKDFYELLIRDSENILKQANQIKLLREALSVMVKGYCDLVDSGDAGFWDPEKDDEVIKSRAALAATAKG